MINAPVMVSSTSLNFDEEILQVTLLLMWKKRITFCQHRDGTLFISRVINDKCFPGDPAYGDHGPEILSSILSCSFSFCSGYGASPGSRINKSWINSCTKPSLLFSGVWTTVLQAASFKPLRQVLESSRMLTLIFLFTRASNTCKYSLSVPTQKKCLSDVI